MSLIVENSNHYFINNNAVALNTESFRIRLQFAYLSSDLIRLELLICFAFICRVRDTHQIAEAQQEKNAKLREAFGISEYFVEGTSFDGDRKAKEDLAKSTALQQELQQQRDKEKEREQEKKKKYALVRTPSPQKVGENETKDDQSEDE